MEKKFIKNFIISICILVFIIAFISSSILFSQDIPIDVEEVIAKIDEQLLQRTDFSAEIILIKTDPEEGEKVRTGIVYRKDEKDKFLFIFTSPKVDVGKGYLYIDDNLWFYDPSSREFTKKTLTESIGGTDTKSRDLESSKLSENFTFEYLKEGKVGKIDCYILKGEAKVSDIAYPKTKMWIRKNNYSNKDFGMYFPIKREEYSISDRLSQTIYYISYSHNHNKEKAIDSFIPNKMLIKNELEKGNKTLIEFQNISIEDLPDNIFTKAYLENQNR